MTSSDSPGAENTLLIERFYAAFGAGDGEGMAACYAPGAHFADPVFPDLRGSEPGEMWRMLTATPGDLRIGRMAARRLKQFSETPAAE